MSGFWAKFSEPLPDSAFKPNNASAIFGGNSSYGLRPAEPSIFRPSKPPSKPAKERRKVTRSNSDVVVRRGAVEKRKASYPRKLSESRPKNHVVENGVKTIPVSPRSDTTDAAESEGSVDKDLTDSGEFNGDRYPLFISVKDGSQAEVKPRGSKSSNNSPSPSEKASEPEPAKKGSGSQGQRASKGVVRRSSSFSTPRRSSDSGTGQTKPPLARPRAVVNQQTGSSSRSKSPGDSLRREKSDVRPRGSQSPASPRREKSDVIKLRSPQSTLALRREKSDITLKRSQSPGGFKRENSDLVRPRGSASPASLRREKSDLVIPRGSGSPLIGRRENTDLSRPRTKAQVTQNTCTNQNKTNVSGTSPSGEKSLHEERSVSPNRTPTPSQVSPNRTPTPSQVSPIPTPTASQISLNRTPTPSQASPNRTLTPSRISPNRTPTPSQITPTRTPTPTQSQESLHHIPHIKEMSKIPTSQSRIPSLSKHSASQEQTRVPPKSKIPSLGKGDKKGQKTKESEIPPKSHIPGPSGSITKEKSASRIPGAPGRPDSAKENKDPTLSKNDSIDETNKQSKLDKMSRIPSCAKVGPQKSKIPSIPRQDSQGKSTSGISSSNEQHIDENVFTNGEPESTKSKIPSLSSPQQTSGIPTSGSKIPSFSRVGGSSKPDKAAADKVDSTPPVSKIPGLGASPASSPTQPSAPKSGSPSVSTPTGIPKPDSKEHTESKIPTGGVQRSKIPGLSGSKVARKPSEEKTEQPSVSQVVADTPEKPVVKTGIPAPGAKVAPPPPPRQDVNKDGDTTQDTPMELIFFEAKKMEQLLRDEDIVVEVPVKEQGRAIETTPTDDDVRRAEVYKFEKGEDAEELISEVLKSYAPELQAYSSIRSLDNDVTEKPEDVKLEVSFKTFGKRTTTEEKPAPKEEKNVPDIIKADTKKEISLDLTKSKDDVKKVEDVKPGTSNDIRKTAMEVQSPLASSPETPTIDTLGQYEQQARRSRSRQRKVITPDTEEPRKTFEDETANEKVKKGIDKDKFGKTPFETENTKETLTKNIAKPAKTKSKHEKPKFVIESSLGKDFYSCTKASDTSESKQSHDDAAKPSEMIVIQNKTFDDAHEDTQAKVSEKKTEETKQEAAAFDDVELSSHKGSKQEMKAWSMDELDEKTVQCVSCSRGGMCSIM